MPIIDPRHTFSFNDLRVCGSGLRCLQRLWGAGVPWEEAPQHPFWPVTVVVVSCLYSAMLSITPFTVTEAGASYVDSRLPKAAGTGAGMACKVCSVLWGWYCQLSFIKVA